MSWTQIEREHARLIILKALEEQPDGRLNSEMLRETLDAFAIKKTRDWVHEELRWLADIGAVAVSDIGTVRVASITSKGQDHIARRVILEGVRKPSRPEA